MLNIRQHCQKLFIFILKSRQGFSFFYQILIHFYEIIIDIDLFDKFFAKVTK